MELKEFVKKVIIDLDKAVSEANKETDRDVRFKGVRGHRTSLEFDVAVTVESGMSSNGGGGIKVWGIAEANTNLNMENKNSTISRVSFCIDINNLTKQEEQNMHSNDMFEDESSTNL